MDKSKILNDEIVRLSKEQKIEKITNILNQSDERVTDYFYTLIHKLLIFNEKGE